MRTKQLFALAGVALLGLCAGIEQLGAHGGGGNFGGGGGGGGFGGGGGGGGFGGGGGRGNYDPAQMQQQMQQALMDLYREQLEVKDDAEWKVIGDQVKKVMDAQTQASLSSGGANMLRAAFQRQRGGGQDTTGGGGGRRAGMATSILGGGQPDPDLTALQKAIDDKASNDALKTAMTRVTDGRKAKQAKLEQAQGELRKLLSVRQEAIALSLGLF